MKRNRILAVALALATVWTLILASGSLAFPGASSDGSCSCHDFGASTDEGSVPADQGPAPAPETPPLATFNGDQSPMITPAPISWSVQGYPVPDPVWPVRPGEPVVVLSSGELSAQVGGLRLGESTLVALEDLATFLGAEVQLDPWWMDYSISLPLGSLQFLSSEPWATLNGEPIKGGSPNMEHEGIFFVPVDTVAEMLGGTVSWDPETSTALVEL